MAPTTANRPHFVNPFDRQRSVDKVPSYPSVTQLQPLLTNDSATSTTSSSSPPNSASWRNRAASMFQSISSNSSNGSSTAGGQPAMPLKERMPSTAVRKPSYVPKYAARAHLSSMTGRMTIASDGEIDEQLRRESRMMSVVSAASLSSSAASSSSGSAGRKPS